jgi:Tfp pilus assembly protein PilF
MISIILIVAIIAGMGWMAWRRWGPGRTPLATAPSAEMSQKTLAYEAFTRGNTCLAAGQFADATAAFEQARTLDPKRPYVAERLAEVARRQHAASAPAPVAAGG